VNRPRICAVIIDNNLAVVKQAEEPADLFEVRIDLIGDSWRELAKQLDKPWIACNRVSAEGGQWGSSETERVAELLEAVELGADIIDIELGAIGLAEAIRLIKGRAKCLLSFHDLTGTPSLNRLREVVQQQLAAGADICKVVTTAQSFEDNITVLQLISEFPSVKIVSFAMGHWGLVSRVLCPLVGSDFTYASTSKGKESASGQITAKDLRKLYEMVVGC
jgi:3-dehydroquinate dehydratase type I